MCCGFDNDYIQDCENGVQAPDNDNKRLVKKLIAFMGVVVVLTALLVVLISVALITTP